MWAAESENKKENLTSGLDRKMTVSSYQKEDKESREILLEKQQFQAMEKGVERL